MEWNVDRIIGVMGLVLAIIALALGLGVGVGVDTKSIGEVWFVRACFALSAVVLLLPIIMWGIRSDTDFIRRWVVVGASFAFIGVSLLEGLRWVDNRRDKSHEHEMPTRQDSKPPTLLDLFKSDFGTAMKAADTDGVAYRVQAPDGSTIDVQRQEYMDFPARTKFIGFYIHRPYPPSPDFKSDKTVAACFQILQDNLIQDSFNKFEKNVGIMAGREDQMTRVEDLVFSGRVLIYHEDFLSITQKADILKAYQEKGFDVQFMGDAYLGSQVIAWHQKHDSALKPQ